MEAVHADWKEYLNLLICEESHLKYMEDYHQVPAAPEHDWERSVPARLPRGLGTEPPGASRGCLPKPARALAFEGVRGCAPELARPRESDSPVGPRKERGVFLLVKYM